MPVTRTRFAPSPTGVLHLGSVRTALFCWLFARHCSGQFVLRIEDTDRQRSTDENVRAILDGLEWLGLEPDEGPVFQSSRFNRYREVVDSWLESGTAYRCYCTQQEIDELREKQLAAGEHVRYDGRCRNRDVPRAGVSPVIRFRNPDKGQVVVKDIIRGTVTFDNAQLDDLVIARSDGSPTYNFAVVVDDYDMEISHVIRGDDHLNNTPRQINMLTALQADSPNYAHVPMILGPDGSKLSKRHGAVDIRHYRDQGFLPTALLNYLVRLGWSHGDQEIFTLDEMIDLFDIADVNQSASVFNTEKLLWVNQQHIISTDPDTVGRALTRFLPGFETGQPFDPDPANIAYVFRERAETLKLMADNARFCYEDFEDYDPKAAQKHMRPAMLDALIATRNSLSNLEPWDPAEIDSALQTVLSTHGMKMGKLGQLLRVAVTGRSISPPIDKTLWIAGRSKVLDRLDRAIEWINVRAERQKQ